MFRITPGVCRLSSRFLAACLYTVLVRPAVGQDAPWPESPEALVIAIAEQRVRMAQADSAGDLVEAIRLRLELAPLSRPKDALVLYADAVALADSAGRPDDAIRARQAVAELLIGKGQAKQAYQELKEAIVLSERLRNEQVAQAERAAAVSQVRFDAEQDSLIAAGDASRRATEQRVAEADERGTFWMWMAVAALAVGVTAIVLITWMNARALRRHRAELVALRADVHALTERHQNRLRDTVAPEKPVVAVPVAPPFVAMPSALEVDPIVMGMFRKQTPERLVTLREARARNDREKVRRVVHSLKPQLASLDPAFAVLCARITATGGQEDPAQWDADLDALEVGIARLLR